MAFQKNPTTTVTAQPNSSNVHYSADLPALHLHLHDTSLVIQPGNESHDKWMIALFYPDPPNTCSNCTLSCVVPCVQYGKTQWRLSQIVKGGDPHDSGWRRSERCNSSCWAWCGIHSFLCFGFVATGFQRNRIRAIYGIDGDCLSDFLLAYLCLPCVTMQNDREVRAREGEIEHDAGFRSEDNSSRWMTGMAEARPTQTPPARIQPMRYVSPRETSDHASYLGPDPPSCPQDHALYQGQNMKSQQYRRLAREKLQKYRRYAGMRPTIEIDGASYQHRKNTKSSVTGLQGPNIQNLLTVMEGLTSSKRSASKEIEMTSRTSNLKGPDRNVLAPRNEIDLRLRQHILAARPNNGVENRLADSRPKSYHQVECAVFDVDIEDGISSERRFTECESIGSLVLPPPVVTRNTREAQSLQQGRDDLSYLHDFSDCPIDRSVLVYYEKEEKRSKEYAVDNFASTSAAKELHSNKTFQVAPSHCHVRSNNSDKDIVARKHAQPFGTASSESAGRNRGCSDSCSQNTTRSTAAKGQLLD